jgi:PAS domain S-box-containing protein
VTNSNKHSNPGARPASDKPTSGPDSPPQTPFRFLWLTPEADSGIDSPDPRDWLSAIIEGSDDAIISKDLRGIIQSWNHGATRLFGYSASEAIGKPITILIPDNRLDEEPAILAQIQLGNRVDHFETQRRRKDGTLIDISLTISPIRNSGGDIIGASKIARDITERHLAEERQQLLMHEMQHRVKNLFALATAIVSISARSSANADDVIGIIQARLSSLARAHELTMSDLDGTGTGQQTEVLLLIRTILEPYATGERISVTGTDLHVSGKAITNIALLLYEMATNAAKHGSLSAADGRLAVRVVDDDDKVRLVWQETGGPAPAPGGPAGFGSRLERGLAGALGATIDRDWQAGGLVASIAIPKAVLSA